MILFLHTIIPMLLIQLLVRYKLQVEQDLEEMYGLAEQSMEMLTEQLPVQLQPQTLLEVLSDN